MNDSQMFDHRPDPELGAALRAALEPSQDQSAFVARVMAGYDEALRRATVPTWDVLASWFRPGVASAAAALLAGVFMAGGLAGWGGNTAAERDDAGMRGRHGPDAIVAYLSRELDLSTAQRDSVRAIFERHRPETDSLWAQVRPRFDSIKARMRAEIDAQLTPAQREKHQRLIDKAEHHRRESSGERGGGGPN